MATDIIARGMASSGGTSDYDSLNNKPQVNSVTLSGNKTTHDLSLFEQVSTMPVAGSTYVDKVVQYIGDTTSDYEQGLFYICELQGDVYSWNYLQVVQTASTSDFGAVKVQSEDLINITDGVIKLNTATGNYSMTVGGNASTTNASTNVGYNSSAYGWGASAFGADAQVGTNEARVPGAIQLGRGSNTTAGTMCVGLSTNGSTWNNYTLLGADGKVPLNMVTTVDNVTSASNQNPLSANQGKVLNDRINNLESIGRYLSIWNCSTGLPVTNPSTLPYTYRTGDYYRIGTVSDTTNYKPSGSSYDGTASTTVASETTITVGDIWFYDGTTWSLQENHIGGFVEDVQVNGASIVSDGIANIPYANSNNAGVLKVNNLYGTEMKSSGTYLGNLLAQTKTYSEYSSLGNDLFIGKGTLENVLTGKDLNITTKTTIDATLTVQTEYYLGETATLTFALPSSANAGQYAFVKFVSGTTATTLTVTGAIGDVPTPIASKTYELLFTYNGSNWVGSYRAY